MVADVVTIGSEDRLLSDRPILLKAEEAATLLRIGRSTVFELMATGELPSVKIGRSVRIPYAGLLAWVAARTGDAA